MVKHKQTIPPHDIDKLPPANSHRPSVRETARNNRSDEDVIQSLANAYENERARQVVEWERSQSSTSRHAA